MNWIFNLQPVILTDVVEQMRTWGNDDSVDANDDCVVCSSSSSSRMSKWRRKPLSRLSGSRACRANPCVHATYYTVYNLPHCNSNTIYPPNRRHSPIVCTINYPNITLANICLASLSLANTAILFRLLSLSLSCSLSLSSHNLKVFSAFALHHRGEAISWFCIVLTGESHLSANMPILSQSKALQWPA